MLRLYEIDFLVKCVFELMVASNEGTLWKSGKDVGHGPESI